MYKVIERTELAQYGNSPILTRLLCDFNAWIDPTINLRSFYINIWNISEAQGFGLDNWGLILGVSRVLQVTFAPNQFGFSGGPSTAQPFNSAPFNSGVAATEAYALSDDDYRQLLLAKAFANICATTIPMLNRLLMMVFGEKAGPSSSGVLSTGSGGPLITGLGGELVTSTATNTGQAWVEDLGNMQMAYVFDFIPTNVQYAIITQSGVLPHPTGVGVNWSTPSDDNLTTESGNTPPSDPLTTEGGVNILASPV